MLWDAGAGWYDSTGSNAVAVVKNAGLRLGNILYVGDTVDNVLSAGISVEVGPSSASVDVEVLVRYNAVCRATTGPAQDPVAWQFHTPRPGKKFSTRSPASPQVWPPKGK